MKPSIHERIMSKVDKRDTGHSSPCWIWTGTLYSNGYALMAVKKPQRRQYRAHRVAYELFVGPIPEGLQIDHLCRVKKCVNPDHLEPVTNQENSRRAQAVKTHCPKGHPYDAENTFITKQGWRRCRTCSNAASIKWHRDHYTERHPDVDPVRSAQVKRVWEERRRKQGEAA